MKEKKPWWKRKWNETTIKCYLRGCNCEGCEITPPLESGICRVKWAVMELIEKGRKPPVKRNDILED